MVAQTRMPVMAPAARNMKIPGKKTTVRPARLRKWIADQPFLQVRQQGGAGKAVRGSR